MILISDGYDEHSTGVVRGRARCRQGRRPHGLRRRHRRRRRHLAQGRARAAPAGHRDRRPGVLSAAARRARRRVRSARGRRAEPLSRHLHAEQHDARRRRGARQPRRPRRPSTSCGRAAGYRAPKPPPIRPTLEFTVTDTDRPVRRDQRRRSRRLRERRRAEGRHVPRGR